MRAGGGGGCSGAKLKLLTSRTYKNIKYNQS